MKFDLKKFLILNFPYVFMFWFFNRIGEGYRLASGADELTKMMSAISGIGDTVAHNPLMCWLLAVPALVRHDFTLNQVRP